MLKYTANSLGDHRLQEYYPNYANLSSLIGNYAAVLTTGEHYDSLLGDAPIELVHRSSRYHRQYVLTTLAAALGVPDRMRGLLQHTGTIHVANVQQSGIGLDIVQKYEPELYGWLMSHPCGLLFSDEFGCAKDVFLGYCKFLHRFLHKLQLHELQPGLLRTLTTIYLGRAVGWEFVGAVVCKEDVLMPTYAYYSTTESLQLQALKANCII